MYFLFLQDIIVICKTPIENTVNDVKYWVSEIKKIAPNVSVILALKQGGGEPKYTFLIKEIIFVFSGLIIASILIIFASFFYLCVIIPLFVCF